MNQVADRSLKRNPVSKSSGKSELQEHSADGQTGWLRLKSLRKTYGSIEALKDISLEVQPGEFVSLLGPSGCGKTTLLGAIAGFVDVDSGTVEIDGVVLPNGTPPYERNLGVVFQQYALFPHLTVRRNVAFPLEIRRMRATEREKLVDDAIAMVDLKSFETRYPAELSGGQQQRVALARALVYSPPVLLLDEPLGALDRRLRDAMQAELMDLHKRLGKTFVYVTHDQDEALAMSDRVVVMRNGLIEQHGTPLELYERPRNAFVAKFVGECNVLTGDWVQVGSSWRVIHQPTGVVLHETSKTPTSGSTASVAIRPEWLSVGTPSGKGSVSSGAVACRVMQTRFHGSDTLLNVQSGLGELLVRLPHQMRATLDLSKDELSVFWTASESVLLDS